jgi:hypothetical protein
MEVQEMAGVHDFSAKVIDYATRLSDVADAAQGRRQSWRAGLVRWTILPASGAALFALVRSDFFARQAKGVVSEAKTLASDLPDDLMGVVRAQTAGSSARNSASQASGSAGSSGSTTSARKTTPSRKRSSASRKRSSVAR